MSTAPPSSPKEAHSSLVALLDKYVEVEDFERVFGAAYQRARAAMHDVCTVHHFGTYFPPKSLLIAPLPNAHNTTPPPPIRRPNLAEFAELVCRIVGFLNLADLFCRIARFLGLCRLVLPTCWGLWVLGHLSWRRHLLCDTA